MTIMFTSETKYQNNKPANIKREREKNEFTNLAKRFKSLRFLTLALSQSDSRLGTLNTTRLSLLLQDIFSKLRFSSSLVVQIF